MTVVKGSWRRAWPLALSGAGLAVVLGPGAAWAQAEGKAAAPNKDVANLQEEVVTADDELSEEEEQSFFNWSIFGSVGTRVGQGTFTNLAEDSPNAEEARRRAEEQGFDVDDAYARWANSYSIAPSISLFQGKMLISGSLLWTHWLTDAGGFNEQNEFRFQDIGLGVNYTGYTLEETGTTFSGGIDFGLPTSDVSQTTSMILSTTLGAAITQQLLQSFNLTLSLTGGKLFHRFIVPGVDTGVRRESDPDSLSYALFRDQGIDIRNAGTENLGDGLRAIEGVNTEYFLFTGLSVAVPIWKLRLSVVYRYESYWSYFRDNDDEFRPNGDIAGQDQTGRNYSDIVRTGVVLAYPINEYVGVTAGLASLMRPKTADNQTFRFPFWNFNAAADNTSSLTFGVNGTFAP